MKELHFSTFVSNGFPSSGMTNEFMKNSPYIPKTGNTGFQSLFLNYMLSDSKVSNAQEQGDTHFTPFSLEKFIVELVDIMETMGLEMMKLYPKQENYPRSEPSMEELESIVSYVQEQPIGSLSAQDYDTLLLMLAQLSSSLHSTELYGGKEVSEPQEEGFQILKLLKLREDLQSHSIQSQGKGISTSADKQKLELIVEQAVRSLPAHLERLTGITPKAEWMQIEASSVSITEKRAAQSTGKPFAEFLPLSFLQEEMSIQPQLLSQRGLETRGGLEEQVTPVRMNFFIEDIHNMLKNQLLLLKKGEASELRVKLFPEHLGHIDVRLTSLEGRISAELVTFNKMAKEAIELQLGQLRMALAQQGIQVEKIEVAQGNSQGMNHEQKQGQAFNQQERKERAGQMEQNDDIEEFNVALQETEEASNINYVV